MENEFLKYLGQWEESIEGRGINFTAGDKKEMFISQQTNSGLKTSVYELIECTKFLLKHGFQCVLSSAFNQDCLGSILEDIEFEAEDLPILQCMLSVTWRKSSVFRGH